MRVMLIEFRAKGSSMRKSAPGASVCATEASSVVLSCAARWEGLPSDDEEARRVVRPVLDLGHQHVEPVDLRCDGARDRRGALLVARAARALGVAADGHALDARQVLVQPAAALRERLRMRAHPCDVPERRSAAHQVLVDAQLDLAADAQAAT